MHRSFSLIVGLHEIEPQNYVNTEAFDISFPGSSPSPVIALLHLWNRLSVIVFFDPSSTYQSLHPAFVVACELFVEEVSDHVDWGHLQHSICRES